MSEDIYIEASHEGFTSVELSCGKKSMVVEVTMEEDFDGVIYTRGSFMTKSKSCFLDADGVKEDKEGWNTQVLIIQHDDWLIFPGDTAFTLQCKDNDGVTIARIGLSDPDPSSVGKE